jgi:hypothetical protein
MDWGVNRLPEALEALTEHPLRSWSFHLIPQTIKWLEEGKLTAPRALLLIRHGIEGGIGDYPSSSPRLSSGDWLTLLKIAGDGRRKEVLELGNILIARGMTEIIDAQLMALREFGH